MASYHLSSQIIGRSPLRGGNNGAPRNVVAMAAYRAGARLRDTASGRVANFSGRRGVVHSEILAPSGSAPWLRDRERLWNHVEVIERRRDAQLAREINLALPHELTAAARAELARGFVLEHFVSRGMVADLAIHEPVPEKAEDPRNHHAHVLLTLRQATPEGLRATKTREWNSDALLLSWRRAWQESQNAALARSGSRSRVDHRTLAVQRADASRAGDRLQAMLLDRPPEIHIGPRARRIEAKGQALCSRKRERPTARPSAGAFRSARLSTQRWRTVDYPAIDRGRSRNDHATGLAAVERRRRHGLVERFEVRQASLSARMASSAKAARQHRLPGKGDLPRTHLRRVKRCTALQRQFERLLAGLITAQLKSSRREREISRLGRIFRSRGRAGRERSRWGLPFDGSG